MSKIKVMSEILANKIAAGEVVEKCASIVKELCENSIDAHAHNIVVNLLEGGKKEITVIDDGDGMSKDDALLAFQRHATSKLYKEDDLFFISTLGFRGEALPSIASVSKCVLKTSDGKDGKEIIIEGGKLKEDKASSLRKGTSITVTKLFYNTPARLKYLKSEQTELANCVSFIERLALANPNIAFTLTNDAHLVVKTSGSNDLLKTIHEIYGLSVSSKMIEVKSSNDDFDLYGYICKPEILKSNRNHMITIVNDRVVKNYDINKAINDAYYTYKPDIKYPIVILKINTDPTLIDVNIHPTKQDIKIGKIDVLSNLIVKTLKSALYKSLLIPNALKDRKDDIEQKAIVNNIIKEQTATYNDEPVNVQTELNFKEDSEESVIVNKEMKELVLYPVGLAHGTYIIAENEEGVYLIDQHAAQERVNYERNMTALKAKKTYTTSLLIPITIELSSSEMMKVKEEEAKLKELGFDFEEFGLNTLIFKGHPTWLRSGYEEESIRKIIDLITGGLKSIDPVKFNESIAITLACKMSIKANMHISKEAMEELLKELCACDNPYNCPHGRPTIIKFSNYDLERMFKRVMN